jgi:c-di-GMP phosphodiesterase
MTFRKYPSLQILVCALFVALFTGAAHLLVGMATDSRNRQQLTEISEQMLRRAELGVDFAFMALGAVAETSALDASGHKCSAAVKQTLRSNVFRHATIKDIRLLDKNGRIICAAFPETITSIRFSVDIRQAIASRNAQIRLMPVPNTGGTWNSLGVLWELDSQSYLMAIVNTSALLFDTLPAAIRDNSSAEVSLSGQRNGSNPGVSKSPGSPDVVALYKPVGWEHAPQQIKTIPARSERFPLQAKIIIEKAALNAWNHKPNQAFLILAGLLGLAFGFLLAKAMFREPHPVAAIDKALAAGEFQPFYQPIFCLQTSQIVGCEVLARWVKPGGQVLPPYHFIPLAEQTGCIVPMTWQLVDKALARMRPFLRHNKDFRIAFNFGVNHLMQDGFTEELRRHVTGAKVGTRNVTIEITEREEISDFTRSAALVAQLRDAGYGVALDDAGTGHSGLSYVQKLGADVIKIDKLFVDSVVGEHSARVLIGLLVNLGKELGMTTVAEGIESQEQADALMELGVDKGQGYLVSPPVTFEKFLAIVELNQMTLGENTSLCAA